MKPYIGAKIILAEPMTNEMFERDIQNNPMASLILDYLKGASD